MNLSKIIELKKIALRNLARHKVKTIITTVAIMVSVCLYIFMDAWLLGMNLESQRNIVNYEIGAAKIQSKLYFKEKDELPMFENFSNWEAYAQALNAAGYDTAPRFVFSGTIYSQTGSAPIVINGVDPAQDKKMLRYANWVETGRFIEAGAFEIALGALTAKKLDIDLTKDDGSNSVRISTVIDIKNPSGKISHVYQVIDAVVVGTINSPDPKNNVNAAYIPLDVLQDEAGMMLEGCITELLVREKNAHDAKLPGKKETAQAIEAALSHNGAALPAELAVFTWKDYAADFFAAYASDDVSSRVMAVFLFILSFLGISNTMLMAILERTKEIGMMRAMGMTDGELIITYMLEAGFVGAIGSILGVIAGCLINIPMVEHGIAFGEMADAMSGDYGYRIASDFRSAWNVPVIILSAVFAMLISAGTAFVPTRRTLKMSITESLRFE